MKKFSFLLIGLFLLSLTACSSDDDNSNDNNNGGTPPPVSNGIVGQWTLTGLNGEGSTSIQGVPINFSAEAVDLDGQDKTTFKADSTYTSSSNGIDVKYTISGMGQDQTDTIQAPGLFADGTWKIVGDSLTLTDSASEVTAKFFIENLTDSNLKLTTHDIEAFQTVLSDFPLPALGDNLQFTGTVTMDK